MKRLSHYLLFGFLLVMCSSTSMAQSPIPCGQLTTGAITTAGQQVSYTFAAAAGDVVSVRLVTSSNNFEPQMQLVFNAQVLQISATQITRTLTTAGTYTIVVKYNVGSSLTGTYQLSWQRTKGPCAPVQVTGCQTAKGTLAGPADQDAFTFNGTSGQSALLQLQPLTTNINLSIVIGLFDPDGILVSSGNTQTSATLPKTGVYTVLVGTNLGDGMAGNYTLSLGNTVVRLTSPNGGAAFLAGTTVPIRWQSNTNASPFIYSQDILLSTDGGATFPTVITYGLSSGTQSFNWRIPPTLSTQNARIRVIATETAGGSCQDDSDASFAVLGANLLTPVAYKYDELSRLTQAVYDNGTGASYTYDAAGNRLSEIVAAVPFFRISCNPVALTASLGGSTTTTCSVTSLNGFNSSVTVACADLPPGVTCVSAPGAVTPPANGTANSTLTVNVSSSAIGGSFGFQATGTGGGFTRTSLVRLAMNQLDDVRFFVRQHYVDFLNRQPDQAGLGFWINNITGCTPQPSCIEVQRINTSAAYFLSIEFQQTGYLVYKIYKAAFGNITDIPNAPVPIKRQEFLPDTQEIGNGVIVNQGNWQQQLEANKQAFTLEFVQRARFTAAFPTTITPAQFVDKLFSNAGVTPSAVDRNAAIAEFGSATTTSDVPARSRALRDVAENATLNTQEFNKAFVLMQYFGYLRRNPYDSPESTLDYSGFNFWLGKLNSFGGNYINAEMVKAFISSSEYRQRFGP